MKPPASKCVRIMPDGTADYFKPKPKEPNVKLVKTDDGYIIARKERALR